MAKILTLLTILVSLCFSHLANAAELVKSAANPALAKVIEDNREILTNLYAKDAAGHFVVSDEQVEAFKTKLAPLLKVEKRALKMTSVKKHASVIIGSSLLVVVNNELFIIGTDGTVIRTEIKAVTAVFAYSAPGAQSEILLIGSGPFYDKNDKLISYYRAFLGTKELDTETFDMMRDGGSLTGSLVEPETGLRIRISRNRGDDSTLAVSPGEIDD